MTGAVAVIGPEKIIIPFKASGALVFATEDSSEAAGAVERFASQGCLFIFISDSLLREISEIKDKYSALPFPCISALPVLPGEEGYSRTRLNSIVKKAIGIDIEGLDR